MDVYVVLGAVRMKHQKSNDPFSSIVSPASCFSEATLRRLSHTPRSFFFLSQSCILHGFLITIDKNLTLAPRPRGRSLITAILILLPIRQHVSDSRTIRQFVDFLEVLL